MDVSSLNVNVKVANAPTSPAVEREDREKMQVTPIAEGGESSKAELDKQAQRRREAQQQVAVSAEEAAEAVREMQERLDSIGNTRLNFSVREKPDAVVVQITDKKSGDLVRQFPAEEALQIRQKLDELVGLLFDEKA